MDDVWGNAWSTPGSKHDTEVKKPTIDAPKWNTFERDADEATVDLAAPSWTTASGVGWGDGHSNLWHAESSTLSSWGTDVGASFNSHVPDVEEQPEPEEEVIEIATDDGKDPSPRPILPTPPQSPLPLPSPPSAPTTPDETPPSSRPGSPAVPGSPDPFGSFESAQDADAESLDPDSWIPKTPGFPPEVSDEPWGGAWGAEDVEDVSKDEPLKDEWALAQEVRRRRDRRVPPDLLNSLFTQWDEFSKDIYPNAVKSDESGSQSWRKGLDNVEGLTVLVESLLPTASFPPPVQFSQTAVAKAVKDSLRLTRSFALTRSSPMAHLYASKGSTDWERSVKAQKTAANDEWGWDLKHEPEEKSQLGDAGKEKKGGLLSFWGRKASSIPSTPAADTAPPTQPKTPTQTSKPASPIVSARPSIDASAAPPSPQVTASPTVVTAPTTASATAPVTAPTEAVPGDSTSSQPSVVSRFFNRFSRKPTAAATSEKDSRRSLSLSANDLSFLSDVVPSSSEGSLSHGGTDSIGSLEAMLSTSAAGPRYSSASSSKLPPPLAPPPPLSSRPAGPLSAASDTSFEAKMAEAQLMDVIANMGPSSSAGYAPVDFGLIDSPIETSPPPVLPSPAFHSPMPLATAPSQWQPPVFSSVKDTARLAIPTLAPGLPLPLPPPMAPSRSSTPGSSSVSRVGAQRLSVLTSTSPAPATPPANASHRSSSNHKLDNPLPLAPNRDLDDFSDFFSAPVSPHQPLQPDRQPAQSSRFTPPNAEAIAASLDFGDFISTPICSPSPPKVPRKTSRAADHRPTMELVEKAASRPGQWPAPPSPLPQPLAPPPSSGYFNQPSMQQAQRDFLDNDSPEKLPATQSGISASSRPAPLLPPLFAGPPSRPASTSVPALSSPAASSRPATPLFSPFTSFTQAESPKAPGKSGLSAQDLSFFEGL